MKKYISEYKGRFTVLVILLAIVSGLTVYSSVVVANIINQLIDHRLDKFIFQIFLWLILWIGIVIIRYVLTILETQFEQIIACKIREDIVNKIIREDYEQYNSNDSAHFISWLNNDIQQIIDHGFSNLYIIVEAVSSIILALVTLLYYNVWLMVSSIVLSVVTLFVPKLLDKKLDITSTRLTKQNEIFVQAATDMLRNFNMLFSFNSLILIKNKIKHESHNLKQVYIDQSKVYGAIAALGFLGNIISQIFLTALTGFLAYQGQVLIGTIFTVASLSGNIFNNIGNMPGYLSQIKSTKPIFVKFAKFVNEKNLVEEKNSRSNKVGENSFLIMRNVAFHYPKSTEDVIHNFTFTFEKGKKYLLDGDSGRGKSTILKLLAGFYSSYRGSILFEGKDIKAISPKRLHEKIFYLDQRPQVIAGTVRDNLRLNQDYSDKDLESALQKAHMNSDKAFLDIQIEPDGTSLSGGQLQRLALARAFLRNFDVFLFDEGTSGVEEKTAQEIEQILLEDSTKTVILVNHNESNKSMNLFDKIIKI